MKATHLLSARLTCIALLLIFAQASSGATIPNTITNTINGFNSNPEGIAFTPNGQYAYVCNNGGSGPYLNVIDVATNTVLNTPELDIGAPYALSFAAYMAITPDGKYGYVTNGGASWVSLIDIATNTVLPAPGLVGPFNGPNGIAITPDGKYAYVTNQYIPTVTVIDIASNTVLSTPGLTGAFNQPNNVVITPDGKYVYVSNAGDTTVSIIDINTNTVVNTIDGFSLPTDMAITLDGNFIYVANFFNSSVGVINAATQTLTTTINGFDGPIAIAVTPSGKYVYVGNGNTTTVSVVDTASNSIITTIDGFNGPSGITITPDGQLAYVSNYSITTVSVIALPVSAPANLQGFALRNTFLLQSAPVNRITWNAPVLPLPTVYNVYRDEALTDLVATIPATAPLMFQEYVLPGSTQSYYVTGTDGVGVVSPAASVVITQP